MIYKFGNFELDTDRQLLLQNGQRIALTSRMFDILRLLLQKSGELITKDELIEKVWKDRVVEENNLTVNMSALRKALGERRGQRKYIETIPKRGYRFAEPVIDISEKDIDNIDNLDQISDERKKVGERKLIRSLAVLPIRNETHDPGLDYLSDGITESIIKSLSQLPDLRVLARNTVFYYKGKEFNSQEIGNKFNIEAVLIGRILQFEDRLIIRMELVDVADQTQLWGEQYNRKLSDIFVVQEEIAREVAENLRFKLSREVKKQLAKRYTENTEAYQLYLKARYLWNQFNKEWVQKSLSYYLQAIEIDSNYALAYAGLADSYLRLSAMYLSPGESLPKAKSAALKAVEIDNQLAEAHAALGLVKAWYDFDWSSAESEFRRAVDLNPSSSIAHKGYGNYFMYLGRFDEALNRINHAIELDPLFLQLYVDLGATLYMMRRYDQAIEQFQKVLEIARYYPARYALSWGYLQIKDFPRALSELEQIWQLGEDSYLALGLMGYVYAVSGNKTKAKNILEDLKQKSRQGEFVAPYSLVLVYAGLAEKSEIFEWLEKLYEDRSFWLLWLNIVPELDYLRADKRFKYLLRRVGFEPVKNSV